MELNYRKSGSGQPVVILHGVFGSSDNWLTFSKQLEDDYEIYLVDQRNHGNSPHSQEFNYEVLAKDIDAFCKQHNLEDPIIVGHSMGGKAAMKYALNYTNISKLMVVDIAPKSYDTSEHQKLIDAMRSLPLSELNSRREADEALATEIPNPAIRQFLLKNLTRENGNFQWKINLDVISEQIEEVGGDFEQATSDLPALFVAGEKSNYIGSDDKSLIQAYFPKADLVTIKDAGHWVHAEQPEALAETMRHFFAKSDE